MAHDKSCITKSCMGCGPESDVGKLQKELIEVNRINNSLRRELVEARERIRELELEKDNT